MVYRGLFAVFKSQQSASHVCVHLSPAVITDCPPLSLIVYLQATFTATSPSGKSDDTICERDTRHSSIFFMATVVLSPGALWTLLNGQLISSTAYFVQQYRARSFPKMCMMPCFGNATETQLPTDDFCVCIIPLVITDGPPLASVVQLHPTFVPAVPTSEADDRQQRALTTITVAPVHFALGIPIEAPRSPRAFGAPTEVVWLPWQLSPASRGRPLQEGRHLCPVQTRDAEVGGVAPQLSCPAAAWEPRGRVPGGEDLRALGSWYPRREREARGPRWPPRAGKVVRVLGTRWGRLRALQGRARGGINAGHCEQCP